MKNLILMVALMAAPLFSEAKTVSVENLIPGVRAQAITAQDVDKYYSYNFGIVPVNFNQSVDFTLTAQGPAPTVVREIHIQGLMYDARTNCPQVLQPGQVCTTRVYFWPYRDGFFPGRLVYFLGDSHIVIDLSGWAQP